MTLRLVIPFDRPVATPPAVKATKDAGQAKRRPLPARPVLGLIDNGKIKADRLLTALGEALLARGAVARYFLHRKTAMVPINDDERDRIVAEADVVVAGLGDCGGCTACSVTDALRCLETGRPAFMLASEKFAFLVDATDCAYGLEGLERLYVEHPVWSREDSWFDAAGERLADLWIEEFAGAAAAADTPSASISDLLSDLRSGMEADGYDLAVEDEGQSVRLIVTAREGTCAACLIPEEMLGNIAFKALESAGLGLAREQLKVTYPSAAGPDGGK